MVSECFDILFYFSVLKSIIFHPVAWYMYKIFSLKKKLIIKISLSA